VKLQLDILRFFSQDSSQNIEKIYVLIFEPCNFKKFKITGSPRCRPVPVPLTDRKKRCTPYFQAFAQKFLLKKHFSKIFGAK
jgi:hypothetical protein